MKPQEHPAQVSQSLREDSQDSQVRYINPDKPSALGQTLDKSYLITPTSTSSDKSLPTSKMSLEGRSNNLFDKEVEIDAYVTVGVRAFFQAGVLLKQIRDNKEFKHIPEVNTWDDYIRFRCKYSRSTVYNYISIVEKFGELLEMSKSLDVDHSRLIQALPYIKNNKDAELWLTRARERSPTDWKDDLHEAKGKPLMVNCDHSPDKLTIWNKCRCGKWIR